MDLRTADNGRVDRLEIRGPLIMPRFGYIGASKNISLSFLPDKIDGF